MKAHINGISLSYDDSGSGPAVLLIHGFPLCRSMWQPQRTAVTAAGFRLVTPDLRGFGESDVPKGPYSMSLFADDIIGLMDFLHIERAIIGGMSMGGYILLNLLERYRQRLSAACFIVTRSTADEDSVRAGRRALLDKTKRYGAGTLAEQCSAVLLANETFERDPTLADNICRWITGTNPRGIEETLPALLERKDYSAMLGSFDLPALVIGADQDRAVQREDLHILRTGLPNSELCIISSAGHLVNLEQPANFNDCLVRFLRTVTALHGNGAADA
jgi:3-oxoadipate enol-lactonase